MMAEPKRNDEMGFILILLGILVSMFLFFIVPKLSNARFVIKYEEESSDPTSIDIQIICCRNIGQNVKVLIGSSNEILGADFQLRPPYEDIKLLEKSKNRVSVSLKRMNIIQTPRPEVPAGLSFHLRFKNRKDNKKPFVDYVLVTADNGQDYAILPQNKLAILLQQIWKCYPVLELLGLVVVFGLFGRLLRTGSKTVNKPFEPR